MSETIALKNTPYEPEISSPGESMGDLRHVVAELKSQLTKLIGINEALEADLEQARSQINEDEHERKRLIEKIDSINSERQVVQSLREEIDLLDEERNTLIEKIQEMDQELSEARVRIDELVNELNQAKNRCRTASQEIECVNNQFSRAMKVIEEQRHTLTEHLNRERYLDQQSAHLKSQLDQALVQRDSYASELDQSRQALEEVRQSILEVSRQ